MPTVFELGRIILEGGAVEGGGLSLVLPFPLKQPPITKTKVKVREPGHCKYVLKLCDAEQCVDDTINDSAVTLALLNALLDVVWLNGQGTEVETVGAALAGAVAKCMAAKVLSQKKPERTKSGKHRTRK